MNKTATRLLFIFIFLSSLKATAQSTGINYTYSFVANAYAANGGAVFAGSPGADDAVYTITPTAATWNGFYYGSQYYPPTTTIYVSTNGWMSFVNQGSSLPNNSLATTPAIIAPLWDDLKVSVIGNINWRITGGVGTRRLIVEWSRMLWDHNALIPAISFEVTLYDKLNATPNVIEFKYRRDGTNADINNFSGGASSGLSGFCSGDYYSYSAPPGGGAPIKTSEDTSLFSLPQQNVIFHLTPTIHPNDNCTTPDTISNAIYPAPATLAFNPALPLISRLGTTLHSTQSPLPLPLYMRVTNTMSDVWFTFIKPAQISNFELFTDSIDCRGAANYKVGIEVYSAMPVSCGGIGAAFTCDTSSSGPAGTNATSYVNLTNSAFPANVPCGAQQYWVRVFSMDTTYRGYFRINIRPPGRICAYAADITPCVVASTYSSPLNMATCGFTNDYDSANATCHSQFENGEDYVFSYTPAVSGCVNLSLNNTPANSDPALFVYNGCPTAGNCMGSVTGSGGSSITFNNLSLAAGNTYYFVVENDTSGSSPCLSNFDFALTPGGAGPANDNCATPITLTSVFGVPPCVGATQYNNNCATPSPLGTVPLPGCGNFTNGLTPDVWFTFTTPLAAGTTAEQIMVSPDPVLPAQDLAMAVYTSSGGSCGPFALVGCDDNSNAGMPSLSVTPPAISTVYYIRVFSNDGTAPGNFRICIVYGCTPGNDLCASAIALTIGQPVQGDNSCSTGTGEPGSAVCWGPPGNARNTVWYSFVATNDTMKIRTHLLTMTDSQIALYSPPCGAVMTQLFCNDDATNPCNGTVEPYSEILATGLTIGQTYLIRVDGYGGSTGTFTIVVVDGSLAYPPIQSQDCALPLAICNNTTFTVGNPGFEGEGNFCDIGSSGTCLAGEENSAWYTFSVTGPTNLQFTLNSGFLSSYSFMLWAIDTIWNGNPNHVSPTVANYCNQLTNPSAFPLTVCNTSTFNLFGTTGLNASRGTITMPTCACPVAGPSVSSNTSTFLPLYSPQVFIPANETVTFLLDVNSLGLFGFFTTGFTFNWQGTPISNNPPLITWVNNVAVPSSVWDGVTNAQAWVPNCNIPDCGTHPIPAFISPGGVQPIINANVSIKDLTINAGATLTINAGKTLTICGNFTNNGTLICQPTSIVKFVGNTNTSISGTFAPTANSFYNIEFAKNAGVSVTLNTNIYVLGYDSIYSGIVNNNSKNTEVGGDFYNHNGSASYTNVGSGVAGSTLTFTCRNAGGLAQPFRNDTSLLTLNNVMMNQIVVSNVSLYAGAFSDMILGAGGVLTLTQGRIITTAAAVREVNVTNNASAACSPGFGAPANSYVEGNLRRAIALSTNSYDFPVGDGTTNILPPGVVGYQRANITYSTAPTTTYNLLAHFWRWTMGGVMFPGNGPAASDCITATYNVLPTFNHGYWRINASIVAPDGIYAITLYNQGFTNNIGSGWTVVKGTSGSGIFNLTGACLLPSTAIQTSRLGLIGFSDFTTVQSQIPLPVKLLFFTADAQDNGVLCQWATATEINNDHFELERSKNNSNFELVKIVKGFGAGTSTQTLSYNFLDDEICRGIVYYRLKQIDIDGKFGFSNVVAVSCKDDKNAINLFPNPGNTEVNISFFEPIGGKINLTISDIFGSVVINKDQSTENGVNIISLKIADLASGVYYVQIKDNGENLRQVKFLKY